MPSHNRSRQGVGIYKHEGGVIMKKFFIVTCALVFALTLTIPMAVAQDMTADDLVAEAKKTICEVSVSDAKALFDKGGYIFLDCRRKDEYKMGHVPGALHIPRGMLEFQVTKKIPDKNANIIMYCKKGGRGCLATCTLCRMGYKNVKNMDGGWLAWEKAGYPIE
jgi:rhodanese-related sulfurtransferase